MDVDGDKPESVVNLTANRRAVFWAAWACFFVGTAWLAFLVTGQVSAGAPHPTGWLWFHEPNCHSSNGKAAWLRRMISMCAQRVLQLRRA